MNCEVGTNWYGAGLSFECQQCGRCCSGPGEGFIWTTQPEIELIAKHLMMTEEDLQRKFLRKMALRTTIVEHPISKDCIFLQRTGGRKQCVIYPVRPNQCRTWPFWPENLSDPYSWNMAAGCCPGINRGRHYSSKEIDEIAKNERWWERPKDEAKSSTK
jgi:Fe-S-cluster containining protein